MGIKGKYLEILDTADLFENYVNNVDFKNLGEIGELLNINLKNKLLQEKIKIFEREIFDLKDEADSFEVKK